MSGDLPAAALLLALAVTLHNVEEMIWLPGFPHPTALKIDAGPVAFRFAAVGVAALVWAVALTLAAGWPAGSLMAGFALAMIVNAAVPHLALTVAMRRYHPGTATACLLVVPAATAVLVASGGFAAFAEPWFAAGAAVGFLGLAAGTVALLALGKRFLGA